jgi:hypothetical protein
MHKVSGIEFCNPFVHEYEQNLCAGVFGRTLIFFTKPDVVLPGSWV